MTCFFIGHREASEGLRLELNAAVEKCIAAGCTEFIVGHYGQFDALAASVVKELKEKYSDLRLVMLLPYHPAEHPIELPPGFDTSYYPLGMETVPRSVAIKEANRRTILTVDYVIAYARHPGNARDLAEYAEKRGKQLEML